MLVRTPLFLLEFAEDGGGGGGAAVAEPAGAVSEPTGETTGGEPAGGGSESFALTREEWEAVQAGYERTNAGLSQLAQYLAQQQAGGGEQYEEPGFEFELDPLDDDYGAQLATFMQQRDEQLMSQFQQMIQPLYEAQQMARINDGMEQLRDIFHDDVQQHGEFAESETSFEMALALGRTFYADAVQRYGAGDRAAEAAFGHAISTLRERDKAIADAAIERYKNEIATLSGAPREPGASGVGTQVIGGQRPDSLRDIARRYGSQG